VPVPLHPRRKRERGFNQSHELARELVRRAPAGLDLTLRPLLLRVRETVRQARLDRRERLGNLAGVYAPVRCLPETPPEGARLLLIDDVITTGATVSECAAVLRDTVKTDQVAAVSVLRG
jgi:predicted amidophosphoribosyltransferase